MQPPAPRLSGLRFAGAGVELAGTVLLCMFLGYQLDRIASWEKPWGLILGAMMGLAGSIYRLFRLLKADSRPGRDSK